MGETGPARLATVVATGVTSQRKVANVAAWKKVPDAATAYRVHIRS